MKASPIIQGCDGAERKDVVNGASLWMVSLHSPSFAVCSPCKKTELQCSHSLHICSDIHTIFPLNFECTLSSGHRRKVWPALSVNCLQFKRFSGVETL